MADQQNLEKKPLSLRNALKGGGAFLIGTLLNIFLGSGGRVRRSAASPKDP